MTSTNSSVMETTDRELLITRRFDAPRQRVFEAWTDPRHAKSWWGPREYPLTYLEMDVRIGGAWRGCLTSIENGEELWQHGVIREIQPPDRLVFTFAWDAEDGKPGQETVVTVTLEEDGGGTLMTFRQSLFDSVENREGHRGGWSSSFDRLDEVLAQA